MRLNHCYYSHSHYSVECALFYGRINRDLYAVVSVVCCTFYSINYSPRHALITHHLMGAKGAMPPNSTPTCQKMVPDFVHIADNNTEIPANICNIGFLWLLTAQKLISDRALLLRPPADPSFWLPA